MNIDFTQVINMKLAVILWLVGFGIKHVKWKPIQQLSNKLIPVMLTILGIGMSCIFEGDVNFDGLIVGVVTSMFAVGVHSSGHNAWKAFMNTSTNSMMITGDNLSGSMYDGSGYTYGGGFDEPLDDGLYETPSEHGNAVG